MVDLAGDVYDKAVQSESITLLVGRNKTPVNIVSGLLALKAPCLASTVAESDGKIEPLCGQSSVH